MPKKHSHRSNFSTHKKRFKGSSNKHKHGGKTGTESINRSKKFASSKEIRDNKIVQLRKFKNKNLKDRKAKIGNNVPKVVAVVNLSPYVDCNNLKNAFTNSSSNQEKNLIQIEKKIGKKTQQFLFYFCSNDRLDILDSLKVADIVIFSSSPDPNVEVGKQNFDLGFFDEVPELITLMKAQGVGHIFPVVQGLSNYKLKQKSILMKSYERYFNMEFPAANKPFMVDTENDLNKVWRFLSLKDYACLEWRHRPYLLAQEINYVAENEQMGHLQVTGFLRGERCLNPNRLVHITGVGDFQIEQIASITGREMAEFNVVGKPDNDQDSLDMIGEIDPFSTVNDQSLITNEEIEAAENERKKEAKLQAKKEDLAERGLSDYGLVWDELLEEENEEDQKALELDENDDMMMDGQNATGNEEEKMEEEDPAVKMQQEAADEKQFPDEVDTPSHIPAKQRFEKYRGLENFRTSEWDALESLPLEYSQIVQVENFKDLVRNMKKNSNGIRTNQKIRLTLRNVPVSVPELWQNKGLMILSGKYEHERKVTVMHYLVQRHPSYSEPIKAKTELLFQAGFRRFTARPTWGDPGSGKKHMCTKFLQDGTTAVASFYGQLDIPPSPIMVFLPEDNRPKQFPLGCDAVSKMYLGSGYLLDANAHRLQIKRKVLTGYPIRVHKRRAVVRFMFFNPDDVRWFKSVELCTKDGLKGRIEEPVGTHGHMKCFFSDHIKCSDIVCLNLYKRQYPVIDPDIFGINDAYN